MKSLICITTCNRIDFIKNIIFDYISFCNNNDAFEFLLAQDGNKEEYQTFCTEFKIPMLYSDKREGVGLSKNRVLLQFPSYDYYFFIDDDVELIDSSIFNDFIEVNMLTNIPHLSANYLRDVIETRPVGIHTLQMATYGGAYFNFFTIKGLQKVGGWNTLFSKYKRYGHTEHTYRYFHQELSPSPFVALISSNNKLMVHNPPPVSKDSGNVNLFTHLVSEEAQLIIEKSSFFSLQTLSEYSFNGFNMSLNSTVETFLNKNKKHYPLSVGKNRRILLAEYNFELFRRENNLLMKLKFLLISLMKNPFSNQMKHFIKIKFR